MSSTIRFFKFITRTNLEDGKLRIPLGFTRKHGDNMSNPVFLKPPDGKEWKMYWTKHNGDILFQKGWKDFSIHYSLGHGHIVFFEYEEETCQFRVHIFNKSTLEIDYPLNGIQDEQHNLNHINEEDSVDILDEPPQCKKTRSKSPISCPQPQKKLRTDTTDDVGRSSKVPKKAEHVQVNEVDNTSVSIESLKVEQDQEQEELTSKIKAALDRASNFKSENPFFTFVMKPSYLYSTYLHVPSKFAKKYLMKGERDIVLQVLDGRTWHCKYHLGKIRGVWKKFVLESNLKVGDVCVFELINRQDLTLKVIIFPFEEEPDSPLPQESVHGDGVNSVDPARVPCVGSKTSTTNKGEEANKFTLENPSFTNEALKEANEFTSENPSFTIVLTNQLGKDYRPRIPLDFARKHGDNMKNPLFLKPPDGKEWKIYWAKHDGGILFQKGWKDFSTHYSLARGHIVLFEYEKETCNFGVHIFNKSTLEIEYPFYGSPDKQHNLNQISEKDSVEILDEPTQYKKTRPKSPISCPQPQKKLRTDTSDVVGRSSDVPKISKYVQVNELEDTRVGTECLKMEQEKITSKVNAGLERAKNFKSEIPFFTFVMTPCYLYNTYLHVPSQFAKKYLMKEETDILLQVLDGRTWHCKYCPGKIRGVWKKFVLENNLKVGDVCVFELTNRQDLTLKVKIFPFEEEPHSPLLQGGKGTQITSPGEEVNFISENPPLTDEALNEANKFTSKNPFFIVNIEPNRRGRIYRPTIPSVFMKKYNLVQKENLLLQFGKNLWPVKLASHHRSRLSRGWYLFTEVSKLQAGDACVFELINREDGVLHVHIFKGGRATQRTSPREEANKFTLENPSFTNYALKEAYEFTSENPFFIINIDLNQLRKGYRPHIPTALLRKYLVKKEIVLLQFGKNLWPVKLNYYNPLKRTSARLSLGWSLFAEESKLEAGDVCVFELINREDAVLHVHIFRGH